jgi:hypothetical protein
LSYLTCYASHNIFFSCLLLTFGSARQSAAQAIIRQLGSRAKQPGAGLIQAAEGAQYALQMEPSPKHESGLVRSVSFFIGASGSPQDSFRIRLYRVDGSSHSPGPSLFTQSLLVAAPAGIQWFTVDLTNYHLETPSEGFFVAMEWLAAHPAGQGPNQTSLSALTLRPTMEFRESRTWVLTTGKGWSLLALKMPDGKAFNAMIRAEITEPK